MKHHYKEFGLPFPGIPDPRPKPFIPPEEYEEFEDDE